MINAFLMMGQSNMAGRGSLNDLPDIDNDHVLVLREEGWERAHEPVTRDKSIAGSGMGIAFGTALNMVSGCDIGLIPCALGGSALDEWQSGSVLFENALKQAENALKSGACISGILWHQGEFDSDNAQTAHTYAKRFERMRDEFIERLYAIAEKINALNRVAQPLPVIVGELGDFLSEFTTCDYYIEVNRQLHELSEHALQYACVSAHGLKDRGDKLHFSTSAQRELGLRYACCWLEAARRVGVKLR